MRELRAWHVGAVARLAAWRFDDKSPIGPAILIQRPARIPNAQRSPKLEVVRTLNKDFSPKRPEPVDARLVVAVAGSSLECATGEEAELRAEADSGADFEVDLLDGFGKMFSRPDRGAPAA